MKSSLLASERPLLIWLPSDYDETGNVFYPVIYMQDGQNLFTDALAYGREWQVDETLERLASLGLRAIVVGIPNAGEDRTREYNPFSDDPHGGEAYLRFIVDEVMPLVTTRYRVSQKRSDTGIIGSSLGGLIALYAFYRHPERFGFVGAMSPALWFVDAQILRFVEQQTFVEGRIYVDIGAIEGEDHVRHLEQLDTILLAMGYRQGHDLFYVEEPDADHEESAWSRRLRAALYFLLPAST
jgi:isoamylase